MTFADPRWLWALLALPVLALLEWRAVRRAPSALARLVGRAAGRTRCCAQLLPRERASGCALRLGGAGAARSSAPRARSGAARWCAAPSHRLGRRAGGRRLGEHGRARRGAVAARRGAARGAGACSTASRAAASAWWRSPATRCGCAR